MEVLASAVKQEKEIQGMQIGKEEVKPYSHRDIVLHVKNPKETAKKSTRTNRQV